MIADNLKEALTKHYSTYALYGAIFCFILPDVLWANGIETSPYIWGRWGLALSIFGLIGKCIKQSDGGKWVRRGLIAAALIIAAMASRPAFANSYSYEDEIAQTIAHIKVEEGKNINTSGLHQAYRDIGGICTYCYGDTKGCFMGMQRTEQQCCDLLDSRVMVYRGGIRSAMTFETLEHRLPIDRAVAFTSWTYNIGVGAATKSTAIRRLNSDNVKGACEAMTWYNKVGKNVSRGLVLRRDREYELCMKEEKITPSWWVNWRRIFGYE